MRTLIRSLLISGLMAAAIPAFAQIRLDINVGPPRPRSETRGQAPSPDAVWVPGYYKYNDAARKYEWQPGRWQAPPKPQQVWVAPKYVRRNGHYYYYEGRWQDKGLHKGKPKPQGHPMNKGQAKKQGSPNPGQPMNKGQAKKQGGPKPGKGQ